MDKGVKVCIGAAIILLLVFCTSIFMLQYAYNSLKEENMNTFRQIVLYSDSGAEFYKGTGHGVKEFVFEHGISFVDDNNVRREHRGDYSIDESSNKLDIIEGD